MKKFLDYLSIVLIKSIGSGGGKYQLHPTKSFNNCTVRLGYNESSFLIGSDDAKYPIKNFGLPIR